MADLYETDFYAWTRQQTRELRRLRGHPTNTALDVRHLLEEVFDLGSEQRHAITSKLERLIEHLLKLEWSRQTLPRRQWMLSVNGARAAIDDRLTKTLRRKLEFALPKAYARGRTAAALSLEDYGEPVAAAALPAACPYTLDQLLAEGWYPDPPT